MCPVVPVESTSAMNSLLFPVPSWALPGHLFSSFPCTAVGGADIACSLAPSLEGLERDKHG